MGEIPDNALPHAIALSWGVAESPQRGPKREMSIERIVETAIEIADADGLSAVSMSRVATSLGYTTMSLYRYVTGKDDLLLLMQDAVAGFEMPPAGRGDDWRAQLREWTLASLSALRNHPWFVEIPISGVPMTPNQLRTVDSGLRALATTALSDQEKMATILLVSGYARTVGGIEHDINSAVGAVADHGTVSGVPFAAALGELVTEERFPYLRPVIISGGYTDDSFDDFAFGLERLLDGVQHFLETRSLETRSLDTRSLDTRSPASRASGTTDADHAPEYDEARERGEVYAKDPAVREIAKKRREAEVRLRDLQKREREAVAKARERAAKLAEKAANKRV
ncbi:TetR/AcrR family transcriptional regulator [Rathayibacter soli]|uniref:TetR/AcrR family transcriptional regulator n=1 Tax=Rathayibacter soli TaxID=3144168 RepID=UPI0027E3F635|nr:TetR/AcrR family transcriptional regulator [Glaciibacter superstes]